MSTPIETPRRRQSLYEAMSRTPGPPSRRRRASWLVSLTAMWGFLAYPIGDVLRRSPTGSATAGALAGLAVFAVLWLRTMWLSLGTTPANRQVVPWFAATAAVGVPLAFTMNSLGFDALFIYLSIAAAVSLPLPATLPALVACTASSWLLLHRLPARPGGAVVYAQLSYVFWLGAMMLFYRRMMLLVIELRRAREELAQLAVTQERLRIARDLHDLLGHSLSTISLKAQLARRLATADPVVAAEIADIESVARNALTEVREAVTSYRQPSLAAELDSARAALTAAGVDLCVQLEVGRLPARTDALLGWVLREAVTNLVRHSGAASCSVRLYRHNDTVVLQVRDDGLGSGDRTGTDPAVPTPGNGLTGLAERVEAEGGLLDAGPAGGSGPDSGPRGFLVAATLPLVAEPSTSTDPSTRVGPSS